MLISMLQFICVHVEHQRRRGGSEHPHSLLLSQTCALAAANVAAQEGPASSICGHVTALHLPHCHGFCLQLPGLQMKVQKLESFSCRNGRLSAFLFAPHGHEHGDSLFLGCESGHISVYHLPMVGHGMKQVKEEEMCLNRPHLNHSARITCLLYSLYFGASGLLLSGSSDRSVKVWSGKAMIQTLQHTAAVNDLADGCDGSMITISMDGFLRVWSPQKGRHMLLNPFFECTFHVNVLSNREAWISALEVNSYGYWGAYVGESDGSISLYRKIIDASDMEDHVASAACPLVRSKRWEGLHTLGITTLKLLPDEGFLLSLSSDGCCKVLDAAIGVVILSFNNPRKCCYTGLSWSSAESILFLTDELGFMQAYNVGREKNIDSLQIAKPSRKQQTKIMTSHSEQSLGGIAAYLTPRTFFTLMLPFSTKTVQATMSTNSHAPGKHKAKNAEELASYGEVNLVKVVTNASCVEFIGHEGSVLGISINTYWDAEKVMVKGSGEQETTSKVAAAPEMWTPTSMTASLPIPAAVKPVSDASAAVKSLRASASTSIRDTQQTLRVSREEAVFFSIANDFTIRCWDEFDATESYQFKSRGNVAFCSVRVIWNMNCIATGYDNGALRLWDSDAGSHIESRVLKHNLTCIIEAYSRSHLLVGADFSGKIAVWNLTQFRQNPVILPVESHFQSHHDPEDSGVLSLAFHKKSDTFFSGGVDRVIKVWKLHVESAGSLRAHNEPVCCLECSDNFLVSGDEGGEILLWSILESSVISASAVSSMPLLSVVCRWYCAASGPSRSIIAMHEIDAGKVCVAQAGKAGKSYIWEVWLQPNKQGRNKRPGPGVMVATSSLAITTLQSTDLHATATEMDVTVSMTAPPAAIPAVMSTPDGPGRNKRTSVAVNRMSTLERERQPDEEFRIMHDINPEVYISVSNFATIAHDEHEATCALLHCTDCGIPKCLYLGTGTGKILKYQIHP